MLKVYNQLFVLKIKQKTKGINIVKNYDYINNLSKGKIRREKNMRTKVKLKGGISLIVLAISTKCLQH